MHLPGTEGRRELGPGIARRHYRSLWSRNDGLVAISLSHAGNRYFCSCDLHKRGRSKGFYTTEKQTKKYYDLSLMASKGNRATFAIKLTRDACTVENAQVKRAIAWAYMIEERE